jgi:predicted nucleic acid-binding protein
MYTSAYTIQPQFGQMERLTARPKLFLDTNICIDVASGTIAQDEWKKVRERIEEQYSYQISFITIKELLAKISRGSDEHFEKNKKALRVLCEFSRLEFLPYPAVFALRKVLRLTVSRRSQFSASEEELYETVCRAVLQCSGKTKLKAGVPYPGKPRLLFRFDLDHFDQHENGAQTEHLRLLKGLQADSVDRSDPIELAAFLLRECGQVSDTESCTKLANALSAVHKFTRNLYELSNNKQANIEKRENDWGDLMQLYYLCDESMHFLTRDEKCWNQTRGSTQQRRILRYKEFASSL